MDSNNKQELNDLDVTILEEKNVDTNEEKNEIDENIINAQKVLAAKEEELIKWQRELAERESKLEAEKVRIQQENLKLNEREKNEEEKLSLKINKKLAEAHDEILKEQAKSRDELYRELGKKREDFDKKMMDDLSALEKELEAKRISAKKELDEIRSNQDKELKNDRLELEKELQRQREEYKKQVELEYAKFLQVLDAERKQRTADLNKGEEDLVKNQEQVRNEAEKLDKMADDLEEREEELKDQKRTIEREKRRLERERTRIEEADSNLEEVVNEKIEDTIRTHESKIEAKDKELENLREQLSAILSRIESVESFKKAYGTDPDIIKQTIKQLEESNKNLRDKLANSSDKTELDNLLVAYNQLKTSAERLAEENRQLNESSDMYSTLEVKHRTLESKYKSLDADYQALKNELENKNQELIRISAPQGRLADREARIASIMTGALDDRKDLIGAGEGFDSRYNAMSEIEWLEKVWKKCEEYGIKFNKRILYAFHTALKINEWSTITVLAGVSGTGKSELPRLYAEFGGLNFCSVAVQPNWDSQESMLGFFNSIDNQFEPEQLLKFLVQCTSDPRYSDYMSIVLLDEMNLAHVEHYFAEFLSKLELRRGFSKKNIPEIQVKLGAGVEPYGLKLSRTVLWTGTMNQDETTKSLSDKVLDRGIVINFPRPKKLESRSNMGIITKYIGTNSDRPKLHKDTWLSWTSYALDFSEEQQKEINRYKKIVEDINTCLEKVGRALGHRVWQSIEYYIVNYPEVRSAMKYEPMQNSRGKIVWVATNSDLTGDLKKAMKTAFEDQIVQKIMPKLRGIETRDKRGKSSLDEIEDLLVNEDFGGLQEDFQIAREQGYGQFMWNSAKYLESDETDKEEEGEN